MKNDNTFLSQAKVSGFHVTRQHVITWQRGALSLADENCEIRSKASFWFNFSLRPCGKNLLSFNVFRGQE